ncbi:hypothetical protein [Achromobacter denitrificans]|uniref:Uncharacterized protein n=1 Tax=Achromobacter denitrificans TaxID=32002 RepID=A0ABZ3GAR5_ACHDE|nr:hypothetical protein [Achromobacter denitrificans]MDF3848009.1 hypothetical protein [Achromobacter denitrificans]MDF3942385.1 hypothetical protein [Achromobacter denitrificans]QCS65096.1 hypothetical protein EC609_23070 [Achromobacter denitrificans]
MKLKIKFPKDIRTGYLLSQERVPCLCKVSKEFEVSFSDTVPESSGVVFEWDRKELELRAIAGAGGQYTHYANSLITLKEIDVDTYQIIDLEMFYARFGWCVILKNGEYARPGDFWDEE